MIRHIVRDFLKRRLMVLLLSSAFCLILLLLGYSLNGPDVFGSMLVSSAMVLAGVAVGVFYFDCQRGFTRALLHLPVDRRTLTRAYWVLAVGVPTAWTAGLALIAWLAAWAAGRVDWLAAPRAAAFAFFCSGLLFCWAALENEKRAFGGEPAPRWARVAIWTFVLLPGLAGFLAFPTEREFFLSTNSWQLEPLLVLTVLGAAFSILGFARTRSLLTARGTHPGRRAALPAPAILERLFLLRNLRGFAAITASCLWIPIAMAGGLGVFLASYIWIRHLTGLDDWRHHVDFLTDPATGALLASYIMLGFAVLFGRFANPRALMSLPVSARKLGACVTLLPAALVLLQALLAVALLYALGRAATMAFFWPLVGAVGVGALFYPACLFRPKELLASLVSMPAVLLPVGFWLVLSVRNPALQAAAPLVCAAGLFAAWGLSTLVFRYARGSVAKPTPLQQASPSAVG